MTSRARFQALGAVREVLANPALRRVEASWTLAMAADQAFLVIALVVAYQAGGVVGVGLVGLARTIPALIVAIATDVERGGRPERALLAGNATRAISGALVAAAIVAGVDGIAIVLAAAVMSGAGVLLRPSANALRPALASSPRELVAANAAASTGEGAGTFVGPLLAGVGLSVAGAGPALVAVAAAFALATIVGRVSVSEAARPGTHGHEGIPFVAGLRVLARRPGPTAIMIGIGAQVLVRGLLTVLIVVLAVDLLGLGDGAVGGLTAAIGLGGLLGAAVSLGLAGRSRLAPAVAISLSGWGIPIAVVGLVPHVAVAVAALIVVGLANAALDVAVFTLLQRTLRGGERGAVFAVMEVTVALGIAAGTLLAPPLVAALGVPAALVVTGAILPAVALLTWARLRHVDDETTIPEAHLRVLRQVPMLQLLPLTALERLALDTQERRYEPGEILVREGEPGDAYYVLASGRVSVQQDGRPIRELGAGEGFGEIALLRTTTRTATVTAREPVRSLVIGREAFLGAVTGHAGAAATAGTVVEERLESDRRERPAPPAP